MITGAGSSARSASSPRTAARAMVATQKAGSQAPWGPVFFFRLGGAWQRGVCNCRAGQFASRAMRSATPEPVQRRQAARGNAVAPRAPRRQSGHGVGSQPPSSHARPSARLV